MSQARVAGVLVAAAVVVGAIAIAVTMWVVGGGEREPSAAPSPSRTAVETATAAGQVDGEPTTGNVTAAAPTSGAVTREDPEVVSREFAKVWVDESLSDAQWRKRLGQYASPALIASLEGVDRSLASSSDATQTFGLVSRWGGQHVSFGKDKPWIVTVSQDVTGVDADGNETMGWIVTGVTYESVPKGTAVPIGIFTPDELAPEITKAGYAIYGDPGGMTDAQRAKRIKDTFTTPTRALSTQRTGTPENSIVTGDVTALTFGVTKDGELIAQVTVPYAADGAPKDQIRTGNLAVVLAHGKDGKWVMVDAYIPSA